MLKRIIQAIFPKRLTQEQMPSLWIPQKNQHPAVWLDDVPFDDDEAVKLYEKAVKELTEPTK